VQASAPLAQAAQAEPDPPPAGTAAPARRRAVLHAPFLDLLHEPYGLVLDLLLDAPGGEVGQALVEPSEHPGQGDCLPRERWFWDGFGRRFVARLTRTEILQLDKRRIAFPVEPLPLDTDVVPLESNPFDSHELETFSGQVTQVEEAQGRFLIFELRDPENHYRRVYVAPANVVPRTPDTNDQVEVEAVQTRDERGALWIAATLRLGDERIDLRNALGRVPWPGGLGRLQARWVSAQAMVGRRLATSDGHWAMVVDLWFSADLGRVESVVLRLDDGTPPVFVLPWSALSWNGAGAPHTSWTVDALRDHERNEVSGDLVPLVGAPFSFSSD
jgi:hypothetical protein